MSKRYKISKGIVLFWTLFIGIGALAGGLCMIIKPDGSVMGMQEMLPYFQVLPLADKLFQDFLFPGIALIIVNGITNIVATGLIFANKKSGIIMGMIFGITLMAWIIIQFVIFPPNVMSSLWFVFGILQAIAGYVCLVRYNQDHFEFDEREYQNVGKNPSCAVVYFSRLGYTKKIAYQIADEKGADIYQIATTEKTDGDLGFLWCGRYGMHKWGMSISDMDLSGYDSVIICSPIWVFGVCSPVREFCRLQKGKLKNVGYVITHTMKARFENVADDMDELLDTKHVSFASYSTQFGKIERL